MSYFPAVNNHDKLIHSVNGRELHEFLGVSRDFSTWITDRINQFQFYENQDFIVQSIPRIGGKGGRPLIEYIISLDMAKELGMLERTQKGREIRQYFIECERQLKANYENVVVQSLPNFNDPVAAARAWADAKESEIKAIQYAEAAKPSVEFVERYVQSTGNLGFRQICKLLKAKEGEFREFLQKKNIMYRLGGEWVPYSAHIDAGRFYVTTGIGDNNHNFTSAKFTPKGVEWIAKLWSKK